MFPQLLITILSTTSLTVQAADNSKHTNVKAITQPAVTNRLLPVIDSVFINTPYKGLQTVSFMDEAGMATGTFRLIANNGRLAITGLLLRTDEPMQYDVVIAGKSGATVSKKILVLP